MLRRTLPRCRMVSTLGGMRRILKNKGTVPNYIRQAVETGVYRTNEELAQVWKERRESADDLRSIMDRFRQDIVRGTHVHDYPAEYLILQQHPPVPDPPRIPKKILKKMRPEPNPTELLVRKYLQRQEQKQKHPAATVPDDNDDDEEELLRASTNNKRSNESSKASSNLTTEEYYRRLLGVPAPALSSALGQKSAAIQKAYAAAVHHYQLERTEGMSEEQALEAVETLLAEQSLKEKQVSRERAMAAARARQQQPHVAATAAPREPQHPTDSLDSSQEQADASTMDSQQTPSPADGDSKKEETGTTDRGVDSSSAASIFHASPRTVEAMMRWSERLQAVPYQRWTVGASTALDHWIARKLLSLSEETWLALLEGEDPTLLSAGRDIVAVRESLFPETRLDDDTVMDNNFLAGGDVDEGIDRAADLEQAERNEAMLGEDHTSKQPREKTIEELLASLGGLDDDDDSSSSSSSSSSSASLLSSGWDTTTTTAASRRQGDATENNELDTQVDQLVEQLQDWRRMNQATPYKDWSADDKDEFNIWLKEYVSVLTSDAAEKGQRVDYDTTREALLAEPPVSRSESEHFWEQLQDEGHARALLDEMRRDGPPPGASILQQAFWDLSYDNQLERLLNLGAVRPLVDEYTKESDRLRFLQRHADTLLEGVPLQYLVPDPHGPIKASDLPASAVVAGGDVSGGSSSQLAIPPDARFRLELRPYKSAAVGSSNTNDDDDDELLLAAEEKSRALFKAWNQHKAGRAKYEERLFQTGRLGLQYSDKILADHEWGDDAHDDDDFNKDDSNKDDSKKN